MMKRKTKDTLIVLSFMLFLFTVISVGIKIAALYSDTKYETGVIITPNPEYSIELQYSNCESQHVSTFRLEPRLFSKAKVLRMNYTAPSSMHLWYWVLTYGDDEVYRETIDREVKAGDGIQFIYVVD